MSDLLGAQDYIDVDATLPSGVNFGPAERAQMVKESLDISEQMGTVGSGYIPKNFTTNCQANTEGLFAFYSFAEAGFILTCRTPDGAGSGWAGITGIKDISQIDAGALTRVASDKAVKSVKPRAIEPGRYTVILEPRANARFLSLMTGILNAGNTNDFIRDKSPGDKIFSDQLTLRSEIGNPILRQTPILTDNTPAAPATWIENGVLRNRSGGDGVRATPNMSLVMEGTDTSIEDMISQTRRGLRLDRRLDRHRVRHRRS
jgi:predicted Zn-dependent protease